MIIYIVESKDESRVNKNFKKKNGLRYKIIDTKSKEGRRIYNNAWPDEPWKDGNTTFALAVKNNKIIGIIKVKYKNNKNVIGAFNVNEQYRGYGIGEELFKYAVYKLDGNYLGVYADNEIAIELYKKYGFIEVNRYVDEHGDEVIEMERK